MRITSESAGAIQSGYASAVASGQSTQSADGAAKAAGTDGSFDQVNLSKEPSGTTKLQRELVSRLVQEVRTATSTGTIQQLRDQVQNGTYQVDPESIASAMLLEN